MNILKKIFGKNSNQHQINLVDIPNNYYVGQEYVEDPSRVPVEIHLYFVSPGVITSASIDIDGKRVLLEQEGSMLHVIFQEKLSQKLFNDLKKNHTGDRWILGYVTEIMPHLNQEILSQRYRTGHFLIRTYSTIDISIIFIINRETKEKISVAWPRSLPVFPEVSELAPKYDRVYIRDLVDSIHAYFNGDYEECVRKAITSIETFIKWHKLQTKKVTYKSEFEETVRKHLNIYCPMILESAADVIMDAYHTRNKIVHDGERLDPVVGKLLGRKTTHLVNEVYKNYGTEDELKRYALYLECQFQMQEGYLVQDGYTLQGLEIAKQKNEL